MDDDEPALKTIKVILKVPHGTEIIADEVVPALKSIKIDVRIFKTGGANRYH